MFGNEIISPLLIEYLKQTKLTKKRQKECKLDNATVSDKATETGHNLALLKAKQIKAYLNYGDEEQLSGVICC